MKSERLASGYSSNFQIQDGLGWKTEANLHSDMTRTMYREGYNQEKLFHKENLINNDGRLKKNQAVNEKIQKKIIWK